MHASNHFNLNVEIGVEYWIFLFLLVLSWVKALKPPSASKRKNWLLLKSNSNKNNSIFNIKFKIWPPGQMTWPLANTILLLWPDSSKKPNTLGWFWFCRKQKLSDKNQTKLELVSCLSNDWNTMPLVSSEEKAQIHLQTLTICTQEAG